MSPEFPNTEVITVQGGGTVAGFDLIITHCTYVLNNHIAPHSKCKYYVLVTYRRIFLVVLRTEPTALHNGFTRDPFSWPCIIIFKEKKIPVRTPVPPL